MRQNGVVVWLECLLVDVVRHTGTLASDRVEVDFYFHDNDEDDRKQCTAT